jgi:hypothetical protein
MKEKDVNSKMTSADNAEVLNSEKSDYKNIDRTSTIRCISSKSVDNGSDKMGEAIRRWESSRYGM